MKRKILLIIGCMVVAFQVMAQTETKKEILKKEKKQATVKQEFINAPMQPIGIEAKMGLPDCAEPKTSVMDIYSLNNNGVAEQAEQAMPGIWHSSGGCK